MDVIARRVYDDASDDDGYRVLVDRLWPRGVTKERAALDEWIKELGPSKELRAWFGHVPERFAGFRDRYRAELAAVPELWQPLVDRARAGRVCLLFGAKDTEHNQAVVLREWLLEQA